MILLFWICTILLLLIVLVRFGPQPYPWLDNAFPVLVVIDLILLGLHIFGFPR